MKITLHISKVGSYQEEITKFLLDLSVDLQDTLPELLRSISNDQHYVALNLDIPYNMPEMGILLEFVKLQNDTNPWITTSSQLLECAVEKLRLDKNVCSSRTLNFNFYTPQKIKELRDSIELIIKASGGRQVAASDLQKKLNLDAVRTRRFIRELIDDGKVIFTGKARATRYYWRESASAKTFTTYSKLCAELSINIPKGPVPSSPKPTPKKNNVKGPGEIKWEEQPLGEMSDYELSEILKVTRCRVLRARTKLGITAFRSQHATR